MWRRQRLLIGVRWKLECSVENVEEKRGKMPTISHRKYPHGFSEYCDSELQFVELEKAY